MMELSPEYMNKLANQILFISALLGGFSLTVLVLLLENKTSTRLLTTIFRVATVATGAFLVTIFAMTKILMMTTPGYPLKLIVGDLTQPKMVGVIAFLVGIIAVVAIIALAGWTKSKNSGIFATIVGIITLIFVCIILT